MFKNLLADYGVPDLPSYDKLLETKKKWYSEDIKISERGANSSNSSAEGVKLIDKWSFGWTSSPTSKEV